MICDSVQHYVANETRESVMFQIPEFKTMLVLIVIGALGVAAFWGTVLYVGLHFVAKFW